MHGLDLRLSEPYLIVCDNILLLLDCVLDLSDLRLEFLVFYLDLLLEVVLSLKVFLDELVVSLHSVKLLDLLVEISNLVLLFLSQRLLLCLLLGEVLYDRLALVEVLVEHLYLLL